MKKAVMGTTEAVERTATDYGLDVAGQFTRPEIIEFKLRQRHSAASVSLARTAMGLWMFGCSVQFKRHQFSKACRALGQGFTTREAALTAAVIELVERMRGWRGTQRARLAILAAAKLLKP